MSVDPLGLTVEQFAAAELERKTARYAQIRRLLQVRDDHLPAIVRRTETGSGFVHQTVVDVCCPDCLGEHPVVKRCPTCHGRGTIDQHRDRDPYAVNRTLPFGLTEAAADRDRAIDEALSTAARDLARFPGFRPQTDLDELASTAEYGWVRARRRMYATWDLAALDVAVERLRHALPTVAPASDRGVRFIEPHMPDPIRAPAAEKPPVNLAARGRFGANDPGALKQRDTQIRRWHREDMPVQWIAQQVGLSVSQVNRIVRKEAA